MRTGSCHAIDFRPTTSLFLGLATRHFIQQSFFHYKVASSPRLVGRETGRGRPSVAIERDFYLPLEESVR